MALFRRTLSRETARLIRGEQGSASVLFSRFYHKNVVDHYDNPRNVGSFDKSDPNVGTGPPTTPSPVPFRKKLSFEGLVGAPACGDVMKFQIKVDDDGNIVDSCFKTFGCASAIASSSVATEWVKGQPMEKAAEIRNSEIADHLSLPPVKLHCSMLAEDAIKAAINDIKKKKKIPEHETPEVIEA